MKRPMILADLIAGATAIVGPQITVAHVRTVSEVRAAVVYLARMHTEASYPEIGAALGYASHSSAVDAHNSARRRVAAQSPVRPGLRRFGPTFPELLDRLWAEAEHRRRGGGA